MMHVFTNKAIRYTAPYFLLFTLTLILAGIINQISTATLNESALNNGMRIIIDAGHGGEDGGAVSCTGIAESQINLEISTRLNDLLHILGYPTTMIRTTDRSVATGGKTIASRKVSDLKERLRIINSNPNALLVSIHQNYFSDDQYSGAQIFYAKNPASKELASMLQININTALDPKNTRKEKLCSDVYLMDHSKVPAILIECGFLSNREEEAKLRTEVYQKKLCITIAASVSVFLDQQNPY